MGCRAFTTIIRIGVKHLFFIIICYISLLFYTLSGGGGSARFALTRNPCAEEVRKGIRLVTANTW